jgi:hypothetical protein
MNTLFVIASLPSVVIQLDAHVAALLGMTIGLFIASTAQAALGPAPFSRVLPV